MDTFRSINSGGRPATRIMDQDAAWQKETDAAAVFQDFFESSSVGFISLSLDGTVARLNRAGGRLLGVMDAASAGRLESYVVERDRAAFRTILQHVVATEAPQCGEVSLQGQQDTAKRVWLVATPSSCRPECHIVMLDLADGAALQQGVLDAQDNLQSTLDALPDLLLEVGLDGFIHRVIAPNDELSFAEQRDRVIAAIIRGLSPSDAEACLDALREANENRRSRGRQVTLNVDGEVRWFELSISRKTYVYSDGPHFLVLARNISKRKRAEELLNQNQAMLQTLAKVTPLAMCRVTAAGDCIHVNEGWHAISGRPQEDALGNGWLDCVHPDDRERVTLQWRQAVGAGAKFEAEYRLCRPEGEVRWVHCQSVPEKSDRGEVLAYVGVITDITRRMSERDQLEEMVRERTAQLLSMVMELTTTEERERSALSQELHDGLAQRLAIAKLRLSSLIPDERCLGGMCGLIAEMESLVDEANEVVRSLSLQLSAPLLHEFGLLSALEWLADEMYRSYGLTVVIGSDGVPMGINQTILNQVYRATRELLINVGKHAHADIAEVTVVCENDRLTVCVADAGVGFDPDIRVVASTKGGYGLFGVRQRMGFIGGDVQIDSRPGDGSLIVLSVPLEFQA